MNTDDGQYKKNVGLAAIKMSSSPTLRKKVAVNALQHLVVQQFWTRNPKLADIGFANLTEADVEQTNTIFELPEDQMMKALGYDKENGYKSYSQVLKLYKGLSKETVVFDALGYAHKEDETEDWEGFTTIVAQADRQNGNFRIMVPPKLVYRLIKPQTSFNGLIEYNANCKYSPELMDKALFHYERGEQYTEWYEIEELRQVLGAWAKTMSEYRLFKERCLDEAIYDINNNEKFNLLLEVETDTRGDETGKGRRKVTHVRFKIKAKAKGLVDLRENHREFSIQVHRANLESVGVAKNQVDYVIEECTNEDGRVEIPFLDYCIQKGIKLKRLSKYEQYNDNQFGGILRNEIVRGEKERWFKIQELLIQEVKKTNPKLDNKINNALDSEVQYLRKRLESDIIKLYLEGLEEFTFATLTNKFELFYALENQASVEDYHKGVYGEGITNLSGEGLYMLKLFLDTEHDIFTYEAFHFALYGR